MIELSSYFLFLAASVALIFVPGPAQALVVATSISGGVRAGALTAWAWTLARFFTLRLQAWACQRYWLPPPWRSPSSNKSVQRICCTWAFERCAAIAGSQRPKPVPLTPLTQFSVRRSSRGSSIRRWRFSFWRSCRSLSIPRAAQPCFSSSFSA